jgi:hypothetical protein
MVVKEVTVAALVVLAWLSILAVVMVVISVAMTISNREMEMYIDFNAPCCTHYGSSQSP